MTPSGAICELRLSQGSRVLAERAVMARTWRSRLIGLLGRSRLQDGEAMVFPACRSIHTVGMRFAIDVLFLDQAGRVIAARAGLKPWRLAGPVWRAWTAVELPAGSLARHSVGVGDLVEIAWRP